jgi:hypothetical protein
VTAASFADWWTRVYTRGLPADLGEERRAEIASDVHEQYADDGPARATGTAIVGRTLRGVPADLTWRIEERRMLRNHRVTDARPTGLRALWATATQAWFTPIAVLVGLFDLLFAVGVAFEADGKMPGRAVGPVFLVGFAVAMFAGLWLRWRTQFDARPAAGPQAFTPPGPSPVRYRLLAAGMAAAGVLLLAVGVVGSLYGVVAGVLLLTGAAAFAVRTPRTALTPKTPGAGSIVLADVLIVLGTLPSLAIFWLVIPAILGLVVIGGVIGTGPSARRRPAV